MNRRTGVVGGVLGAIGAAGAAGAVTVVAQQRRATERVRAAVDAAPPAFDVQAADRGGQVIAADGVNLYYEEVGPADAPLTVVFVHGYCLALGEYYYQRRAVVERFGADVRSVFFDQRSHGRSGRSDPSRTTVDQLGRDLELMLADRVPTGPIVLIGHSMGGMTIMALADEVPAMFEPGGRVVAAAFISTSSGKLSTLTLGLPAVFARLETPLLSLVLRAARRRADLVERGRRLGGDLAWVITRRMSFGDADVDPAVLKYLNDMISATRVEVVADFFPALLNHDKAAALVHFAGLDVAVICGDRDLLLPLAHSQAIATALPNAQLTVVEGAGHIVVLERPDVVDAVLGDLVARALPAADVQR